MTHPRDAKGRFVMAHHARTAAAARRLPRSGRAVPPVSCVTAATRLRQPLNGRPTSILIVDQHLRMVMRMSLPSSPAWGCGALAPAAIQQDACRRHARGRWDGLLADDPGEHLDAELGVPPRQRTYIGRYCLSGQILTG